MTPRFVLLMSGHPGSGKSTLARAIADETGAVVVDKDVFKSRLLEGDEDVAGLPEEIAAPMSYLMLHDLGASLLEQGHSVILDTPAYFPIIREKARGIADEAGVEFFIIDCKVEDIATLQERLDQRDAMPSQITEARTDGYEQDGAEPITEPHLQLDTSGDPENCLEEALEYLGYGRPL